jgi:hypothetical protein
MANQTRLYIYTPIWQDPLPNTKAIAVFPDGETMLTDVSYNVVAGEGAYVHPGGPIEMKDCRTVPKPPARSEQRRLPPVPKPRSKRVPSKRVPSKRVAASKLVPAPPAKKPRVAPASKRPDSVPSPSSSSPRASDAECETTLKVGRAACKTVSLADGTRLRSIVERRNVAAGCVWNASIRSVDLPKTMWLSIGQGPLGLAAVIGLLNTAMDSLSSKEFELTKDGVRAAYARAQAARTGI